MVGLLTGFVRHYSHRRCRDLPMWIALRGARVLCWGRLAACKPYNGTAIASLSSRTARITTIEVLYRGCKLAQG